MWDEMIQPFNSPKIKIRRSRKLLEELTSEIDAFFATNPARCTAQIVEIRGRQQVHLTMGTDPVPEALGAITGDVIHNLRAALDLAACEMVARMEGNTNGVYFPFCDNPDDLDVMIKRRNFHRAGPDAIALLQQLKPYRGGNTALRAIHDLDVQDKHHSLIPTLMSFASPAISLWDDDGTRNLSIVSEPDAPADLKLLFPADSALAGKQIIPTLHELVELVDGVIDAFAAIAPIQSSGDDRE